DRKQVQLQTHCGRPASQLFTLYQSRRLVPKQGVPAFSRPLGLVIANCKGIAAELAACSLFRTKPVSRGRAYPAPSLLVGTEVLLLEDVEGQGLGIHPVYVLVLVLKLVQRCAVGAVELHPADLPQRLGDPGEVLPVGLQDRPVAIGRTAIGWPLASW